MTVADRSKRITMFDKQKFEQVNPETLNLYKKYKIDMSIRELSEKTIYQYEKDLFQWFIYILDNQYNQSVTDLTEDDITEFLYYCKQEGNNVERMKRRMASISAFYKFLRKKKIISENPMEFVDRPKRGTPVVVQTFLSKEQVELMREKLDEYGDIQLKTYALFSLSTMARVNAVAHLRWDQIDMENRVCSNVLEKEGKLVNLFFSDEVKDLLNELLLYRKEHNIEDYGWVFVSSHTSAELCINNGTLNEWCKKIGDMIGVPTLHCHDFRHSGAQLMKVSGAPIELISELLNHSGLDVTKKHYLCQDKDQMRIDKDKYNF